MAETTSIHTTMMHNELAETLSLDGFWQFQLNGSEPREIQVPSAWELSNRDKVTEGPARYSRYFTVPDNWIGSRIVLEAEAISYAATVRINNSNVGQHKGLWALFQIDVTKFVTSGNNYIEIEVWKPGKRYPLRRCLAGFIPDVGTTFGGIWQSIRLRSFPSIALSNLRIATTHNDTLSINGVLLSASESQEYRGEITVTLDDVQVSNEPLTITRHLGGQITLQGELRISKPRLWSVGSRQSSLYEATITVYGQQHNTPLLKIRRRVGFRHITRNRDHLMMNDQPLHLRGVLDWGWDADRISPSPSRAEVLDQVEKARQLGFNLLKLCLLVPDETTFDVADETQMPVWLEMPMWLPDVTTEFRRQALDEYDAILARLHHHPSICIISLGCELNQQVDALFLQELASIARKWFPDTLICDNSGSAEAYSGTATSISDFHDYHFYTDPHFFQPLVDHFTRVYQPPKPWIYGEFCDADTLRDFSQLTPVPWWLSDPIPLDRDEIHWTRNYAKLLQAAGITDSGAALTQTARQQATAVRKFIFELVRSRHATGGYVITGWKDTPISTSGVVDDHSNLKYEPSEWQQFNNDHVLIMDRGRRRIWHGGDRPNRLDPYTFWQDENAQVHVALSNGSSDLQVTDLQIRISEGNNAAPQMPVIAQHTPHVEGGEVAELATSIIPTCTVSDDAIGEMELQVNAVISRQGNECMDVGNTWRLWQVPHRTKCLQAMQHKQLEHGLSDQARHDIRSGGKRLIWIDAPDERFTHPMPFWREAIHVFSPHPFWARLCNPVYADMRFYGIATDYAIDSIALANYLGADARVTPIWRRFDARRMTWSDYIVEVSYGAGRLIMSTLRFAGGLGYQPDSLATNPMGAWILKTLLELL